MSKKFSCQIRQILLYITIMKIPLFKNDKELAAFVDKLRPEEIRSLTTEDWNRLYTQIDKLCSKLDRFQQWKNRFNGWRQNFIRLTGGKKALKFYNPQTDFLKKHQSIFIKLNKNYRPEAAHRAKVKEAAARLADDLFARRPEIKTELANFSLMSEAQRLQTMKKIRDTLYGELFSRKKYRPGFKPSLTFFDSPDASPNGDYYYPAHRIRINRGALSNQLYTYAHELWHSVQRLKPYSAALTGLYHNNGRFYLEPGSDYTAYRRQPLEYDVRTFQIFFTSEIFKKIGPQNFSVGQSVKSINRFMHYRRRNNETTTAACRIDERNNLLMTAEFSPLLQSDWQSLNRRFLAGRGQISQNGGKLTFNLGPAGTDLSRRLAKAVFYYRPALKIHQDIAQVCKLFAADADIDLNSEFNDFATVCSVKTPSPQFQKLFKRLEQQGLASSAAPDSFHLKISPAALENLRHCYLLARLQELGAPARDIKIKTDKEETSLAVKDPMPQARDFLKLLAGKKPPEEIEGCLLVRFNPKETFNHLSERKLILPARGLSPHLFDNLKQRA